MSNILITLLFCVLIFSLFLVVFAVKQRKQGKSVNTHGCGGHSGCACGHGDVPPKTGCATHPPPQEDR
ncbi:MAG: hypothetical protein HKM93_21095 [Desulfobacteraceae bacterium]|nr:hypothetical protein [Desulfobacteraceae bacterium]